MSEATTAVHAEPLRDFVAVGMPEGDAASVAALMTEADPSGLRRARRDPPRALRQAHPRRRHRALHPEIRIVEERAATALLDGGNAMGHLVMSKAA